MRATRRRCWPIRSCAGAAPPNRVSALTPLGDAVVGAGCVATGGSWVVLRDDVHGEAASAGVNRQRPLPVGRGGPILIAANRGWDTLTVSLAEIAASFDHNDHGMRRRCGEVYASLRTGCPVFWTDAWGGYWVASRYQDVYDAGRDPDRFSSAAGVMIPEVGHGRPLLPMEADAPDHLAYRELLLPRFAPAAVASLESDVREFAASLVDGVASRGSADLYETLAKPLPLLMITRLLGIERDDLFWEWVELLMYGRVDGVDAATILATAQALYGYLGEQLELRRQEPGDDLLSLLLVGEVNGRPYTPDEILDLGFFLVIAGIENTAFSIRATLRHLAVSRDDRAALAADPGLISNLVEQSLRLYAPVTGLSRTATRDTDLGGQRIHTGDRVLLLFGSANRDETVFEDADDFHLDRRDGRHVAFGIGPHRCVGSHLARLEIRIAVEELLRRIPDFQLAGPDPGWYAAGPLNVVWHAPPTSSAVA
jgi:cytochrome P450